MPTNQKLSPMPRKLMMSTASQNSGLRNCGQSMKVFG